jgi:uncharacterized protein DUF3604
VGHQVRPGVTNKDWVKKSYDGGVPMGGDLPARPAAAKQPKFLVWALKDPDSAPLQRIQIIKGWVGKGEAKEQIFDVACSDQRQPDPTTHRCPDNGARVNLNDCSIPKDKGAVELSTVWTDPAFKAEQRAFYYARVEHEAMRARERALANAQRLQQQFVQWQHERADQLPGGKT